MAGAAALVLPPRTSPQLAFSRLSLRRLSSACTSRLHIQAHGRELLRRPVPLPQQLQRWPLRLLLQTMDSTPQSADTRTMGARRRRPPSGPICPRRTAAAAARLTTLSCPRPSPPSLPTSGACRPCSRGAGAATRPSYRRPGAAAASRCRAVARRTSPGGNRKRRTEASPRRTCRRCPAPLTRPSAARAAATRLPTRRLQSLLLAGVGAGISKRQVCGGDRAPSLL